MAAEFAYLGWVAKELWLPGSHLFIGLHEKTGCVRTAFTGSCASMAGGSHVLVGLQLLRGSVARLLWVAELRWLISH